MKKVSIRIEVPEAEHRQLKLLTTQRGTNLNQFLLKLIRGELATAKDLPTVEKK